MTQGRSPRRSQERIKTAVFSIAAVLLPFVVVLLIEGVLRMAGVGQVRREPFQPVPGRDSHLALDPDFGAMFFRGFRPGVAFDPFTAVRQRQTFRVFALGGSTTAGFPYHWYYGFPARLEDRLAATLPGHKVEVANLGMTATNSYTVRALAEAVVGQRPDAVVIYAGHNEFYGAYGTGGTQGWTGAPILLKRLVIAASRWATVAGLGSFFEDDELPPGERRTLMARVVENASIRKGTEAYEAGVEQYESNLRDALQTFEEADIPVFLATLTSNLAGQPPLGEEVEAAEAYQRGRDLLSAGDTAAARTAFLESKEADGLRFRAPEAVNTIVGRLAREFLNVTPVDIAGWFRASSPGGLEGESLFCDHLHPNARGYSLMADAFYDAMRVALPSLQNGLPVDTAATTIDPIEANYVSVQLAILTNGYPFRKDRTPAEAEAAAREKVEVLAASHRYADRLTAQTYLEGLSMANALNTAIDHANQDRDTLAALQFYDALLHWQPLNEDLIEQAVSYAIANPLYDEQTAALARFAAIQTGSLFSLNAQAAIAIRQREFDRAEILLEEVEHREPESREMLFNRARLLVLQGDTTRARDYFERYRTVANRQ